MQDLLLAMLALVALSPILLLASFAIKLGTRGPILYKAERAGRGGRPINVYKFRTMVADADRQSPVTVGRDTRITPVGSLLRSTKVDELPQLWNIIRGEMSVVGPRPETMSLVESYYDRYGLETLSVRPGLTCPGNLLYYVYHEDLVPPEHSDATTFYVKHLLPPKLLADLHYVRNRSLTYDWKLIATTFWIIGLKLMHIKPDWQPTFAMEPPYDWQGERFRSPLMIHSPELADQATGPAHQGNRIRRR